MLLTLVGRLCHVFWVSLSLSHSISDSVEENEEDDIAISSLFFNSFDNTAPRKSGPTTGAFLSFEETLSQAEVAQGESSARGPTPFEKRLGQVEAVFGECW